LWHWWLKPDGKFGEIKLAPWFYRNSKVWLLLKSQCHGDFTHCQSKQRLYFHETETLTWIALCARYFCRLPLKLTSIRSQLTVVKPLIISSANVVNSYMIYLPTIQNTNNKIYLFNQRQKHIEWNSKQIIRIGEYTKRIV
jgi:hypothetical protein